MEVFGVEYNNELTFGNILVKIVKHPQQSGMIIEISGYLLIFSFESKYFVC